MTRSRDATLILLSGQSIPRLPVFSGLPSLTAYGLNAVGIDYHESHTDAAKMAAAAASTFELFGFESAVVPFDLCVEAEALGCRIDFQTDVPGFLPPVVSAPLDFEEWHIEFDSDLSHAGRIPLVAEALQRLKSRVGREIAVGAWIPGPFTLAWQLFGGEAWLSALAHGMATKAVLETMVDFLTQVVYFYHQAGADFITVHEMGGSPQVIGAANFRKFVKPALVKLLSALPSPKVLSVCGDTNAVVEDLAACGADALGVDQRNDLARTRRILGPKAILLGNFDPVETLSRGTPATVSQAVASIAEAGVNAFWPGCDLWPEIPEENFRALMKAATICVIHPPLWLTSSIA